MRGQSTQPSKPSDVPTLDAAPDDRRTVRPTETSGSSMPSDRNETRPSDRDRGDSAYRAGNVVVLMAGGLLMLISVLVFLLLRSGPENGDLAILFVPIIYACVGVLVVSLISTAVRKRKLPAEVRKLRILVTLGSFLALLLVLSHG